MKIIYISRTTRWIINIGIISMLFFTILLLNTDSGLKAINTYAGNPIYKGSAENKEIAIIVSIDEESDINSIIEIMDENNININLFADYDWMLSNKNSIEAIINKGHEIGIFEKNNDYSNIKSGQELLKKYLQGNKLLHLLDYDCSSYTDETVSCDYTTIIPTLDLSKTDTDTDEMLANIQNGAFIKVKQNIKKEELQNLIDLLIENGYDIVKITNLLEF